MQEPGNIKHLFDGRLESVIQDFVFEQIPSSERNSGLAVEAFTCKKAYSPLEAPAVGHIDLDVDKYLIITVTDKCVRFHHLDNWWEPSKAGYNYYERARRDGRHRILRHYHSIMDRYGAAYCYLPNQLNVTEFQVEDVEGIVFGLRDAGTHVKSRLWHDFQLKVQKYLALELRVGDCSFLVNSIYSGAFEAIRSVRAQKN